MTENQPKLSDDQIRAILVRAAELQQQEQSTTPGDSRSMTLAEVEQVALEAGISSALVRRAAAEIQRPSPRMRYSPWLGGPTAIVLESSIEGEVPESLYELLVEEIRRRVGEIGTVSTLGRTFAWSATPATTGAGRQLHVTVVPRNGRTTIRIEESLKMIAGGLFGGLVGGLGGGGTGIVVPLSIAIFHTPLALPIAMAAWVGSVFLLARRIYRAKAQSREDELRELLTRMLELCQQSVEC